jgi:protein-S-isoprenylcysteine O-methyltransferase Ste14
MQPASSELKRKAFFGLAQLTAVMALFLFLPAGTLHYPQAWIFLVVFVGSSLAITLHLVKHDPGLLARRVDAGPAAEKRARQRIIQVLASGAFLSVLVVPALDHRFSWSPVPLPVPLVALGDALVAIGFLVVFRVFQANSFTSAVVEVEAGQEVIDSGPYAWVRHPMYAGALILLAGIPLALGSLWGLLTLGPFIAIIVWRLLDEEAFLSRQLPGYEAYRRKTRYRLVPGVW